MGTYTKPCAYCRQPFKAAGGSRKYCCAECRTEGRKLKPNPKKGRKGFRGKPRQRIAKTCIVCGEPFEARPSDAGRRSYCGYACYRKARWGGTRSGPRPCVVCGESFVTMPSQRKTTCGPKCERVRRSRACQGEKSPLWRGGKMAPYNGAWREIRAQVYARDGHKCALCGSTDRIQAHHKIPYRYSRSHDLDNLVTLCRPCHSREELKVNAHHRQTFSRRRQTTASPPPEAS